MQVDPVYKLLVAKIKINTKFVTLLWPWTFFYNRGKFEIQPKNNNEY